MHRSKIADRIDGLLTQNDIMHLEYDEDASTDNYGINCKGNHNDLGRTLHMLYINNLNDNTHVVVVDECSIGDGAGLYWFIHVK